MKSILVLDDDPLISMLVEDFLEQLGLATIGPADTVVGALALLDSEVVDGAILDVSLPGGTSSPVAQALTDRGVPFAFATGYGAGEWTDCFPKALILPKPFVMADVGALMKRMFPEPEGS